MRALTLIAAFLLAVFCFVNPASAANPDHLNQLRQTGICIGCDLQGADLKKADLRGVNLNQANLQKADLREANMMAASLRGADLRQANLTDATVLVVDMTNANLKDATLDGVSPDNVTLCNTTGPDGRTLNRDCDQAAPSSVSG